VRLGWSHGDDPAGIRVEATAKVEAKTGVEMAALTAVSVACAEIFADESTRIITRSFGGVDNRGADGDQVLYPRLQAIFAEEHVPHGRMTC